MLVSPFPDTCIEKQGYPDHKFQYNGKEKQNEFGLNWNDYGARMYDPQLGRWHTVDPMTESQESWTPYHYVYNNPVLRTDPDGRCPDGDCPTAAGLLVNTVKDLAVSAFNTGVILLPGGAYNPAGDVRASRNENGDIQIGIRPPASNTKEVLGNAASDALDVGNTVATVGTGGTGGLATNGGLLLAKTGGKAALTNGIVQKIKGALPDDANVVRGGTCKCEQFENGSGVTINNDGTLDGVSVNSKENMSIKDLSQAIPNGKVGTTTVGAIRKAGGNVVPSPTTNNPNHSTLSGITGKKAEELFNPVIKNPNK